MSKKDKDLWESAPVTPEDVQARLEVLHVGSGFADFYKPHAQYGMSDWPPSLARQEFAEECDINTIMERYDSGETITHVARSSPLYLDYTAVPDNLMDAMNFMEGARMEFMRLPAKVRKEFDNDPARFVSFAEDPANLDQMRAWDLAPKPPEPPAPPAAPSGPAAPPPAPPASAGPATQ